jgi:peptide/nickel transport system ATP-binding protein
LFARPAHPYTAGLLAALPDMDGPRRRLEAIAGFVPEPWAMPPGCAFAPRCALADAACGGGMPDRVEIEEGHRVACLRPLRGADPAVRAMAPAVLA